MPHKVEPLYVLVWSDGKICTKMPTLDQVREHVQKSLRSLREDHKRSLNPTPYKVRFNPFNTKIKLNLIHDCIYDMCKVEISHDYHFIYDL